MRKPTRWTYLINKRKCAGLKQRELAALMGVHETTIARWELGIRSTTPQLLRKLAVVLQVPIEDLVTTAPEPPPQKRYLEAAS